MSISSRRQFLESVTLAGVAWLRVPAHVARAIPALRIGVLVDDARSDAATGSALGGAEAIRSAALFNRQVDVFTQALGTDLVGSVQALLTRQAAVLVSGVRDLANARVVFETAQAHDCWILNAGASSDGLRTRCPGNVFHVAASDATYAAALRAAAVPNGPRATMWDASLERFGAGQLNARYRARYGAPMSGEAWAGWMAMKIAVESYLRTATVDARLLMAHAEAPDTRFDGHKGISLSFRTSDHQLRQPVYVVTASGEVAQYPESTAAGQPDLLGVDSATPAPCR